MSGGKVSGGEHGGRHEQLQEGGLQGRHRDLECVAARGNKLSARCSLTKRFKTFPRRI